MGERECVSVRSSRGKSVNLERGGKEGNVSACAFEHESDKGSGDLRANHLYGAF